MHTNSAINSSAKLLYLLIFTIPLAHSEITTDEKLQRIVEVYNLEACETNTEDKLTRVGRKLFELKDLSGDYDVSCSDCHLEDRGLSDGLKLAVGVGGHGSGDKRTLSGGAVVPRNAFTLFARGSTHFRAFFWDGKVDSSGGKIFSPFGDRLSSRFTTSLAVAAILPLTERDEFLGTKSIAGTNELIAKSGDLLYQDKYDALSSALINRIASSDVFLELQNQLGTEKQLELADIGNALASFIKSEFSCVDSAWEKYLQGQKTALTTEQSEGAVLFFGKARCAGCHQPPLFSDFDYHSLGVPQGTQGPHPRGRDLGRAGVTNNGDDLYHFRTPPLVAVSQTAPYAHNGVFPDLRQVVEYHVNPISYFLENGLERYSKNYFEVGQLLASRSERLKFVEIDTETELRNILLFLEAL